MELSTAIELIKGGLSTKEQQRWCDLGCGDGLFSRALAAQLPGGSTVYAIDKDTNALQSLGATGVNDSIIPTPLDFVHEDLPVDNIDGILMANSLHYVKNKESLFTRLSHNFGAGGRFIIVEYEMTIPNPWVPYPLSFQKLGSIVGRCGWDKPIKLAEVPSSFSGRKIYAALLESINK